MKNIVNKISDIFKNKKNTKIIFIIGIIGILLIFVSSLIPTSEKPKEQNNQNITLEDYAEALEKKTKSMVEKINGAGRCEVMITMERGTEYIYAKEEKTTDDTSKVSGAEQYTEGSKSSGEQQYIIVKTDNGEEALLVTEIAPKVKGVVVVCEGGSNETVRQSIINAVTTALDVSSSRVCVSVKSKNN